MSLYFHIIFFFHVALFPYRIRYRVLKWIRYILRYRMRYRTRYLWQLTVVNVTVSREMPLDIDLANAQLRLWDYKLLERVHTPISRQCEQAVDTFTYSYFRLASGRQKVRLVLTHFVVPTDSRFLVEVTRFISV